MPANRYVARNISLITINNAIDSIVHRGECETTRLINVNSWIKSFCFVPLKEVITHLQEVWVVFLLPNRSC